MIPGFDTEENKLEFISEFSNHKKKSARSRSMDFLNLVLNTGNPSKAYDFLLESSNENPNILNDYKNYS